MFCKCPARYVARNALCSVRSLGMNGVGTIAEHPLLTGEAIAGDTTPTESPVSHKNAWPKVCQSLHGCLIAILPRMKAVQLHSPQLAGRCTSASTRRWSRLLGRPLWNQSTSLFHAVPFSLPTAVRIETWSRAVSWLFYTNTYTTMFAMLTTPLVLRRCRTCSAGDPPSQNLHHYDPTGTFPACSFLYPGLQSQHLMQYRECCYVMYARRFLQSKGSSANTNDALGLKRCCKPARPKKDGCCLL